MGGHSQVGKWKCQLLGPLPLPSPTCPWHPTPVRSSGKGLLWLVSAFQVLAPRQLNAPYPTPQSHPTTHGARENPVLGRQTLELSEEQMCHRRGQDQALPGHSGPADTQDRWPPPREAADGRKPGQCGPKWLPGPIPGVCTSPWARLPARREVPALTRLTDRQGLSIR